MADAATPAGRTVVRVSGGHANCLQTQPRAEPGTVVALNVAPCRPERVQQTPGGPDVAMIEMHPAQRQSHGLSPRLQHAVRLLQMSSLDFSAMLRDTLGRNPFLETEELDDAQDAAPADESDTFGGTDTDNSNDDSDSGTDSDLDTDDFRPTVTDHLIDAHGDDDAAYEYGDRDLWQADAGGNGLRQAEDGELSALEMTPADLSLAAQLHGQLNLLNLTQRDLLLARAVVESLDDDGYLRIPLMELFDPSELDPPPAVCELQIALRHVQALEPAGVGARDVGECLMLQLPSIQCPQARELARRIVGSHLNALAARDVAGLARSLNRSAAEVEAVCDRIRRLDPRPGWRHGSSHIGYVVPDVIVRRTRGQWGVHLNPAVVPKVRLNQVYADLFQRHRTRQNTEMAGHLQEARWTLRNVEQRFSTIVDVAEAIVRRQRHFLEYGPMAMKPLGLREIADEVGIHESTVSRVTNNKYMSTPSGVFELKHFFSRAMVSANGSACSATAIRSLIRDIIDAERGDAPLSDAEITRQLGQQGLAVARRTVTKYRQMLKIEAVDRRRRHA